MIVAGLDDRVVPTFGFDLADYETLFEEKLRTAGTPAEASSPSRGRGKFPVGARDS